MDSYSSAGDRPADSTPKREPTVQVAGPAPRRLRVPPTAKSRTRLIALGLGIVSFTSLRAGIEAGPAWHDFPLALQPGTGVEALGPFWGSESGDGAKMWRFSPLISHYEDQATERSEYEVLYPVFTYDRYGTEYATRFLQFLQFNGSTTVDDEKKSRATLFPIFFRQKSTAATNDYFAILPFYGHLKNRLFRDEVTFALLPLWVSSKKRGVQTDNLLFPILHHRHGGGVSGWQVWPLVGSERKEITHRTNNLEELEIIPGHQRNFFALPFFTHERTGLGTTHATTNLFIVPLYFQTRSPAMDYTSFFLFGHRTNRVEGFSEWSLPWPFIGWANGPGKTARRVWPLYGKASNTNQTSDFFLWPLYTHRSINGPGFRRDRTRWLFFAYSDIHLSQTARTEEFRRRDLWPLFTHRKNLEGQERLQVLALAEPLLPGNKSVERLYSPIWSLYRSESDPKTGRSSQTLLWNLWRRDTTADRRRTSTLFGLVRTEMTEAGRKWRFFWRPMERPARAGEPSTPNAQLRTSKGRDGELVPPARP